MSALANGSLQGLLVCQVSRLIIKHAKVPTLHQVAAQILKCLLSKMGTGHQLIGFLGCLESLIFPAHASSVEKKEIQKVSKHDVIC